MQRELNSFCFDSVQNAQCSQAVNEEGDMVEVDESTLKQVGRETEEVDVNLTVTAIKKLQAGSEVMSIETMVKCKCTNCEREFFNIK